MPQRSQTGAVAMTSTATDKSARRVKRRATSGRYKRSLRVRRYAAGAAAKSSGLRESAQVAGSRSTGSLAEIANDKCGNGAGSSG